MKPPLSPGDEQGLEGNYGLTSPHMASLPCSRHRIRGCEAHASLQVSFSVLVILPVGLSGGYVCRFLQMSCRTMTAA